MRLCIISFTARGAALSGAVQRALQDELDCVLYTKYSQNTDVGILQLSESLSAWVAERFRKREGLLFIGACGIAVRSIVPCIRDKLQDSPVLVMDEAGRYVIPVLSGHYGGANRLAELVAERMHAQAVITTATDVNGLFAVDVFAAENGLFIKERERIAKVSGRLLDGEKITMAIAGGYTGCVPDEVSLIPYAAGQTADVAVGLSMCGEAQSGSLHLIPRALVLGMGCRRGKAAGEIEAFVRETLQKWQLPMEAIDTLATIDLKKEEQGLLAFAAKYQIGFVCFSGEQLSRADGTFTGSAFVRQQVGVDNVCERAAMTAAGAGGRLLVSKTAADGMTIALAEKKWSVAFAKSQEQEKARRHLRNGK